MRTSIHEECRPGSGLTLDVRRATLAVLRAVVPAMFKAQQPWALIGSTASVLQGLEGYRPPDIDLATTSEGAYIMEGAIGHIGAAIRPVGFSVREPYASYFGIFEAHGVKVEVMGDLIIKYRDGVIDVKDHWSRWSDKVRVLHFDNVHVPVIPLEWQLVANMLLERPERTGGISRFLLQHGYDRSYLDALLADRQLGSHTIAGVREVMRND